MGQKRKSSELDLAIDSSLVKFKEVNKEYVKLATRLMHSYIKKVSIEIMSGMTYKIPMRLGFIKIEKTKGNQPIDWVLSKQLKTKIIHKNYSTGGNIYKWKWSKYNNYTIFTNRGLFGFFPTRNNKRTLCKYIQNGTFN